MEFKFEFKMHSWRISTQSGYKKITTEKIKKRDSALNNELTDIDICLEDIIHRKKAIPFWTVVILDVRDIEIAVGKRIE